MALFKSFLDAVGHDFVSVFKFLGSSKGQAAVATGESVANAVVGVADAPALPGLLAGETLFNAGYKQIVNIQATATAAAQEHGTGAQKLAAVVSTLAPNAEAFLKSIGYANPTTEEISKVATIVANGLVAIQNQLPAPAPAASTPKATAATAS